MVFNRSELFIVTPLLLLYKLDIFEVFSLIKMLVKNSFSIVAFLVPSYRITPLPSIRFPKDSLVLHFDWTYFQKALLLVLIFLVKRFSYPIFAAFNSFLASLFAFSYDSLFVLLSTILSLSLFLY